MVSQSAYASQKGIPPPVGTEAQRYGSVTRNEDIGAVLQLHTSRGSSRTERPWRCLMDIVVWIIPFATFVVTASRRTLAHHVRNECILGIITQFHEEIKIFSRNFHAINLILAINPCCNTAKPARPHPPSRLPPMAMEHTWCLKEKHRRTRRRPAARDMAHLTMQQPTRV